MSLAYLDLIWLSTSGNHTLLWFCSRFAETVRDICSKVNLKLRKDEMKLEANLHGKYPYLSRWNKLLFHLAQKSWLAQLHTRSRRLHKQ